MSFSPLSRNYIYLYSSLSYFQSASRPPLVNTSNIELRAHHSLSYCHHIYSIYLYTNTHTQYTTLQRKTSCIYSCKLFYFLRKNLQANKFTLLYANTKYSTLFFLQTNITMLNNSNSEQNQSQTRCAALFF